MQKIFYESVEICFQLYVVVVVMAATDLNEQERCVNIA